MNLLLLIIISIILLSTGYIIYRAFLSKWLGLRPENKTLSYEFQNNEDFVPAGNTIF